MQQSTSVQLSQQHLSRLTESHVADCLQCLIVIYGDTHIDTLAQLLSLQAYADSEYSLFCHLHV